MLTKQESRKNRNFRVKKTEKQEFKGNVQVNEKFKKQAFKDTLSL